MTVPLVIQPEAEADLARAYAWYENRRPGLGAELLDEVDLVFSRIAENPTLLAPVYRDVRRQTLRRFPYVVLHIVRHGNAYVIGVINQGRPPKLMRSRARGFKPA